MSDDFEYQKNYVPERLYVNPAFGRMGAYATIAGDNEVIIDEISIGEKRRIVVSAFYVAAKKDFNTFKISSLAYRKSDGWRSLGQLEVSRFELAQIGAFLDIIRQLDFTEIDKIKLDLGDVEGTFSNLLGTRKGKEALKRLSESPELERDILAIGHRQKALAEFERMLADDSVTEPQWQAFFEKNTWIFGFGLSYVFLNSIAKKLEATTTGNTFDGSGKRVDALMKTRAEVSQSVLIEIKRSSTDLIKKDAYRAGVWTVSSEVSSAVTQIQKTAHEFSIGRVSSEMKDSEGNLTGGRYYTVQPRTFLIVGNLGQLTNNSDKIACFELYRKNLLAPEVLTFDELFYRAKAIVENISS